MLRKIFLATAISLLVTMAVAAQGSSSSTTTTAASSTPAKKPAVFRPTKGQIEQVQTMLKAKNLYDGEASGKYNDPTRSGIKSFQKDNGLKATGTLNRATLEKFGVELTDGQKLIPVSPNSFANPESDTKAAKPAKSTASTSADKPKKPPIFRATVEQIKAAQKMLKERSLYSGEETGKLDAATRDSLRKFQEGNEVKVTGTLNAMTLEKMGIPLTDKQKADAVASASATPIP